MAADGVPREKGFVEVKRPADAKAWDLGSCLLEVQMLIRMEG